MLCLRKSKILYVGKMYLLWVLLINVSLADYFINYLYLLGCKSSPSQVPIALLAIALILGLYYHFSGKIPTLIIFLRM